jgi:hypothetical protein
MGSYAPLSIGGYQLLQTKSYVDPGAISVFTERDRVAVLEPEDGEAAGPVTKIPPSWTLSDLLEAGEGLRARITYRATASEVADRLEAMGISIGRVRLAFERRVHERAEEILAASEDDGVSRAALGAMLREATFLDWSSAFQQFMALDEHPGWPRLTPPSLRTEMMRFIEEESDDSFFGLPGDARWLLRAAAEVCDSSNVVEYDITELVLSGYYELQEPVAASVMAALRRATRHDAPLVVLTEGSTDAEALSGAMNLLMPHLDGYVTFPDFHAANAAGGTGSLVAACRAFAGAGIANRTIALFDNDTAGRVAIRTLERTALPETLRVMPLPDLPLARRYPTIGPDGPSVQDVNGRAASMELYFGEDVLRVSDHSFAPVIWSARDPSINEWQGEVSGKRDIQRRFTKKLALAATIPSPTGLDWAGMRLILDTILHAFDGSSESSERR